MSDSGIEPRPTYANEQKTAFAAMLLIIGVALDGLLGFVVMILGAVIAGSRVADYVTVKTQTNYIRDFTALVFGLLIGEALAVIFGVV